MTDTEFMERWTVIVSESDINPKPDSWNALAPFVIFDYNISQYWTGVGWSPRVWDAQHYVSRLVASRAADVINPRLHAAQVIEA